MLIHDDFFFSSSSTFMYEYKNLCNHCSQGLCCWGGWAWPEGDSITNVIHYIQHLTVNCSRWLETTSCLLPCHFLAWAGGGGLWVELVEDGVFLLSELM